MEPQDVERRLTTVLSADVVGYSRLMGEDEAGTLAALKAHRKELIVPKEAQYHGRTIKLMGDGVLMEFGSVVDAVHFAVEVQIAMQARNAEVPEDRQIIYRVGINIGDIIVEGDDIYGDGVNVAARLEGLAEPGGICASRTVINHVKGKVELDFEDLGEQEFKNIAEPVRVYRVVFDDKAAALVTPLVETPQRVDPLRRWQIASAVAVGLIMIGGLIWWQPWGPEFAPATVEKMALPLPEKPSIAVLPFDNLTGKPELEYFSDGITEDIITNLAKFSGLLVIDRHSVFHYKSKGVDLKEVRRNLGVRYALEGSLQKAGPKTRITAQLVETESGKHLWADRYDFEGIEVFAVRDEILQKIAAALMGSDTGFIVRTERQRAIEENQDRLSAHEFLMRGWKQWYLFTRESNLEARRLFEEAARLDPDYPRVYSALAWTYAEEYERDWTAEYDKAVELAFELAKKGHELDDTDYKSHWALGWAYLYRWEHDKAAEHYQTALMLNANDAELYAEMSNFLIYVGEPDRAIEQLKLAMRLNPLHDQWYIENLGWAYEEAGRPRDAIAVLKKILEPEEWIRRTLAAGYAAAGEMEQARDQVEKILESNPGFSLAAHEEFVRENYPYKTEELIQRWIEALRLTGVPE